MATDELLRLQKKARDFAVEIEGQHYVRLGDCQQLLAEALGEEELVFVHWSKDNWKPWCGQSQAGQNRYVTTKVVSRVTCPACKDAFAHLEKLFPNIHKKLP